MTGDDSFDRALEEARARHEQQAREQGAWRREQEQREAERERQRARVREAAAAFLERARALGLSPESVRLVEDALVVEHSLFRTRKVHRTIYKEQPAWVIRPEMAGGYGFYRFGIYVLDDGSVFYGGIRDKDRLDQARGHNDSSDIRQRVDEVVRALADFLVAAEEGASPRTSRDWR